MLYVMCMRMNLKCYYDMFNYGKINPRLLLENISFLAIVENYGSSTSAGDGERK